MPNEDDQLAKYQPIQCQIYDYVEIACMRKYKLDIELVSGEVVTGKAITTKIKDKQEFMIVEIESVEQDIRLDTIKSLTTLDENAEFSKIEIN